MKRILILTAALLLLATGCAQVPYVYGSGIEAADTLRLKADEPQFERGRPEAVLDGLGHYLFSLPSKLILWDWRVDNHHVSPETEAILRQYLVDNDLRHVKVRINDYDPDDEIDRLRANTAVHPFWRYTIGVVSVLSYTVLPGRLFGGDHYNPYTNTIHIFSDHPSIVLHEGAHAKDFAQREWKGAYAALRVLPLVPLYQEAIATGDAIGYHLDKQQARGQKADYKILYPAYATYIIGEGLQWIDAGYYSFGIRLAAAIPAHIIGRIKAARVKDE